MLFTMRKCGQLTVQVTVLAATLLASAYSAAAVAQGAEEEVSAGTTVEDTPETAVAATPTPALRGACESHEATDAELEQFFADLFDVTGQNIVGWKQDVRLGLYGFGNQIFDRSLHTSVRSMREISGLPINLIGQGGPVNAALVYVNFRSLLIDPNLTELIAAMGGADARLFQSDSGLINDEDGYHYHFRLTPEGDAIGLAAVFVDKRRFTRDQVTALIPKALNDLLFVAGDSGAISPSFRNAPSDVLAYLDTCPRVPRIDLGLIDQIYHPSVLARTDDLARDTLNAQPLELLPQD